jgi:hypothetical protein
MRSDKKIPTWVPILLILLFFGLIWAATRYSVRGAAIYQIWRQGESWDEENVILQTTQFSCGPCAVAMLLKDDGFDDISVAKIAWISGTDLKGTNPEGIIAAGEFYGYTVREEHLDFDGLIRENKPAILYFTDRGILHAVYVRPDPLNDRLIVKNSVLGLTFVYENGVTEYFNTDEWDVYIFE